MSMATLSSSRKSLVGSHPVICRVRQLWACPSPGGSTVGCCWRGLRLAPGSLPCYTFQWPVSRLCRRPHRAPARGHRRPTTYHDSDRGMTFFRNSQTLAEQTVYLSDGAMDVSGAVELHVNRMAREIAPIRLTGNYGSEILRSNVAFRPGRLNRALFTPEFCQLLDEAEETYRAESVGHRLSFIAFKQVPWHHYSRLAVEQSQLVPRSPFLDNELVALAYRAPPELATSPCGPC